MKKNFNGENFTIYGTSINTDTPTHLCPQSGGMLVLGKVAKVLAVLESLEEGFPNREHLFCTGHGVVGTTSHRRQSQRCVATNLQKTHTHTQNVKYHALEICRAHIIIQCHV